MRHGLTLKMYSTLVTKNEEKKEESFLAEAVHVPHQATLCEKRVDLFQASAEVNKKIPRHPKNMKERITHVGKFIRRGEKNNKKKR